LLLPAHIVEGIRKVVAITESVGGHIDNEAAKYGGIAVMGTIGAVWVLRPDGTLWDVDDDFGRPLVPLAQEWHHAAIVSGAQRYPWLAEVIPPAPAGASPCPTCNGRGLLPIQGSSDGVFCPACYARGWLPGSYPSR